MSDELRASVVTSEAFSYELQAERIAQRPAYPYDSAKLLIADRQAAEISESTFASIDEFLNSGDLLVFNNSRVIPARLFGKFEETEAEIEVLLLERLERERSWRAMGRPLKKFKEGRVLLFSDGLRASVGKRIDDKSVELFFSGEQQVGDVGLMPIPPYIRSGRSDSRDREDYQPHMAEVDGSVAAPTASLHFTPELLAKIQDKNIEVECLTLHVGAPSFLPLWSEGDVEIALPGKERFVHSTRLLQKVRDVREQGGRVIAVGTTAVRALESMARSDATDGEELRTDLFISPGHEFKLVDGIVTNFHQPRTSHLLLVQAFIGRDLLESSYSYALGNDFRFLSYGDGMLLM